MKIKLSELKLMEGPLVKLTNQDIPVKVAWDLGKFLKRASSELRTLEEFRIKLVQKYGEKESEESDAWKVPPENEVAFKNEYATLLDQEIDIVFKKVKLADLGDIKMSASDMAQLDKIIEV